MKEAIIIVLMVCSFKINAQEYLNPNGYGAWGAIESHKDLSKKKELIDFLKITGPFPSLDESSTNLDLFHILDMNSDGLLDVAYSGVYAEGMATFFYLNTGSKYEQSEMIPGELIRIEYLPLSKNLEIQTHVRPCCAGQTHTISIFLIHVTNRIKVVNLSNLDYMDGTLEPSEHFKKIKFVTKNQEYKLRATPEINIEFDEWYDSIDGNTVAIYPKGSRGTALAESIDETGRVWWFVLMDNNINPIRSLLFYNNDVESRKSYGWMSSRFLKVIE